MTNEELIFAQYKLYSESKEKFVDRSFATNKFYMILVIALLIITFATKDSYLGRASAPIIFTVIGMITCSLWWLNIDSYKTLIKIKFSKVLEEIEKQLPFQPNAMEYEALKNYRDNQKRFVFSDIQNAFAVIGFLIFLSILLVDLLPDYITFVL